MGLLTEEQIEHVWKKQGLEGHVKRLHRYLVKNGLLPMSVQEFAFVENFRAKILNNFFVKGVHEDRHGRQAFPSEDSD